MSVLVVLLVSSIFVFPASSDAGAQTFSLAVIVNEDHREGNQSEPSIAVDPSGNISVVWVDLGEAIYYSRSLDGGTNFLESVPVNDSVGTGVKRLSPSVAVNETGAIFVVWSDDREGVSRVYFSMSADNGMTFSANIPIVSPYSAISQHSPDIAIANSTIIVVWAEATGTGDSKVFLARSLDWGLTFEEPVRIGDLGENPSVQASPRVAARNDSVFIVWHDSRNEDLLDIYGNYSNDSGANFGKNVKVSDGKAGTRQAMPDAGILPDGRPCAVWHDDRDGGLAVRFARSDDFGLTFLPSVNVSESSSRVQRSDPRVDGDSGGNVSVVYRDNSLGSYNVMYAVSRDFGNTFTPSMRVDPPGLEGSSESVDVTLSPNGTAMVAYDDINMLGDRDIYLSSLIDRPPLVRINAPVDGATISGLTVIAGNASDPDGNDTLQKVEVRISRVDQAYESDWLLADGLEGWTLSMNASLLINGPYEISARSYDGKSWSETVKVAVEVSNPDEKWPDLLVTSDDIDFSPGDPIGGMPVQIAVTVTNVGNLDAAEVAVAVHRIIPGSAVSIGSTSIDSVPAGENRTASVGWTAIAGTHTIRVTVDGEDAIKEFDETNNVATKTVTVSPSADYRADLEVSSLNFTISPAAVNAGDTVTLSVSVYNYGNADANNVIVEFRVDGVRVGAQQFISYIPAGGSKNASVSWVATAGHHVLNVTVDPSGLIAEPNELNNLASRALDVSQEGGEFPVWMIVAGVAIPLVLAVVIIYVMKWRRPKY